MAFYQQLKDYAAADPARMSAEEIAIEGMVGADKARWIAEGLLRLREQIRTSPLGHRSSDNLVIGSWNLRAFDDGRPRRDESYHYIAEIIDHFDICAVQEVKDDLRPLQRLQRLLGPSWEYFVTDPTAGSLGNRERLAFLWNRNKVFFRNLVGEVVLPDTDLLEDGRQFARTPFLASFQAGWFRFTLVAVHIVFGGSSAAHLARRAGEVAKLARIAAARAEADDQFYAVIGDMNIEGTSDDIFAGLTAAGLEAPDFGGTNLARTRTFDQIAFTTRPRKSRRVNHGTVDWRGAVFRPEDKAHYLPIATAVRAADGKAPYSNWDSAYERFFMSFEMSDHLPIWVEVETDYSDDYLARFT